MKSDLKSKHLQTVLQTVISFILEHPLIITAALFALYIISFSMIESSVPESVFLIDLGIDHIIPFSKYASFLYCTWHIELLAIILVYRFCTDKRSYWLFTGKILLGMFAILLICLIFPSEVALRPESVEGTDAFASLTRLVYSMDNCQNVFPSGHAFASVIMAQGWCRLSDRKWKSAFWISLNSGIILSTFLLKQHSVVDAIGGIILAAIVNIVSEYVAGYLEDMERKKKLKTRPVLRIRGF